MFVFIQEHWMPSFEAKSSFSQDFPDYEFETTSSDSFLPAEDIILQRGPVWHGTAIGWHSSISSFIKTIPIVSTRFCGIKLEYSGIDIIAYTAYLPTSGQDDEFIEEISNLSHDISENVTRKTVIVIGMDSNSSQKSSSRRQEAFSLFTEKFQLQTILPGSKPTFHHNNGVSESQIDHILTNNPNAVTFLKQICKLDDPVNISSHDVILGNLKILKVNNEEEEIDYSNTYEEFIPTKIIWTENQEYQRITAEILNNLLETFDLPEHLPSLAEMSSNMIAICAEKYFENKHPRKAPKKARKTPFFSKIVHEAYLNHIKICKEWRLAGRPKDNTHHTKLAKLESQRRLQKLQRDEAFEKVKKQHGELMDTFSQNLSETCVKLKKIRGEKFKPNSIPELKTFLGQYNGDNVLEGFRANTEYLCNEKVDISGQEFSDKFLHQCTEDLIIINDIAENETLKIPPIKLENLREIVQKNLKRNKACDIYKLTPEHLKFAGDKVLTILCKLINRILDNIEYLSAPEFKTSIASVIHKGKNKPKNIHKSYRLVRVCPLIGRLINEYIRPMAVKISRPLQSKNQYGFTENISYLMGALQRHEAQKYCIDSRKTFFGCSLDGDSAFEVVCRIIQQRELYFAGETGQLSQYNTSYYRNTETKIKMNGKISKSLEETLGVGQGKIRSSDHYKIYINPVLETLENANLGLNIGPINVGCSCVADDLYLISDDQVKLQGLLDICQHYGQLYRIKYGANKTVVSVVGSKADMKYYEDTTPWVMDNLPVSVKEDNDHLGLVVSGMREEEKNVDLKIQKARGALFGLLGPAFSYKSLLSPAVQIHLYRVYICPIARSGLCAMTLRTNHLKSLALFQRKILRGFLNLSQSSPIPSLFFLSGELPIEAKLHRDVFSLFYIIWSNPDTKIFLIVKHLLANSPSNSHTWSQHIRNLSRLYDMEDPLISIDKAVPSKDEYNQYILIKITSYHERTLRNAAANNSKMSYLNIGTKGLNGRFHPALQGVTTSQGVSKMRAHIKMLCQDLYTYEIKAAYQGGSPNCRLCLASSQNKEYTENIEHIVSVCSAYTEVRCRILEEMKHICENSKSGIQFDELKQNSSLLTQFILDCCSLNLPQRFNIDDQECQKIFQLSRDLCHYIRKRRMEILNNL